jgi:hypothetical protein
MSPEQIQAVLDASTKKTEPDQLEAFGPKPA